MAPMQIAVRTMIGFRPATVARWLRALASRLPVSRSADDTLAATYMTTRKWSDQTERGLHSALSRHPWRAADKLG